MINVGYLGKFKGRDLMIWVDLSISTMLRSEAKNIKPK